MQTQQIDYKHRHAIASCKVGVCTLRDDRHNKGTGGRKVEARETGNKINGQNRIRVIN